jgi:hypothetical protein
MAIRPQSVQEGQQSMVERSLIWPNFYVVGAVKSGTTSVWAHLKRHPQVFLPGMKEPHFFADSLAPVPPRVSDLHCPGDLERYQSLYAHCGERSAVGDASPSYLWDENAPKNIHRVCPHARIIVLLRDPVERAYSQYLMNVSMGQEELQPLEAMQRDMAREEKGWWSARLYVALGRYASQIQRYFDVFGKEQVSVFSFDQLKREPQIVFSQIAEHIGVDPGVIGNLDVSKAENPFRMPRSMVLQRLARSQVSRRIRHAILPESMRARLRTTKLLFSADKPRQDIASKKFLQEIYMPEMNAVENLLGRKMPELRKSWL